MLLVKNYNHAFKLVKVMYKTLWPLFPDTVYILIY